MVDGRELLLGVHDADRRIIDLLRRRAFLAAKYYEWQIENKQFNPDGEHTMVKEMEHVLSADKHNVDLVERQFHSIVHAAHEYAKLIHAKREQLHKADAMLAQRERALR